MAPFGTGCHQLLDVFQRFIAARDEVDFAFFHIDLGQGDFHGIAQAVDLAAVLAAQGIRRFIKFVIVVGEQGNMDQAFDAVFQAYEEAERRNARNVGFKGLADEGQHVLALLEVVRFPFGFDGNAFARAGLVGSDGMVRQGLLRFFLGQLAPALVLADQAVDHEVRVAADRRREMGITFRSQAEVAGIGRRIAGLLHGAQGDGLDDSRFIGPLGHFQELLEVCRLDGFRIGHGQVETGQDGPHHFQPFRFGQFVDTVDRRVLAVPEIAGYGFIGDEHAFFDDLFGNGPFPFFQAQRHAFRVEDDLVFRKIEVDGPAEEAHVLEDRR